MVYTENPPPVIQHTKNWRP